MNAISECLCMMSFLRIVACGMGSEYAASFIFVMVDLMFIEQSGFRNHTMQGRWAFELKACMKCYVQFAEISYI